MANLIPILVDEPRLQKVEKAVSQCEDCYESSEFQTIAEISTKS
jgi:F0F1-type ATP synthase delta subunit